MISIRMLGEPVGAAAEEAEVPEDLKLLADFVADVGVLGMKFRQGIAVGVDIRK